MAFTLVSSLVLGSSKTGLSLRAQLLETDGSTYGSEISTGFVEIGSGTYLWTYAFPDNFQGGIKIYASTDSATILTLLAINPQEAELVGTISDTIDTALSETVVTAGNENDNVEVRTGVGNETIRIRPGSR